MTAFRRFDPHAFLAEGRNRNRGGTPAKAAKPAKVEGGEAETLATLATLAGPTPEIENLARRSEAETEPRPATLIAPMQWLVGGAVAADEPPYDEPYSARRGVIRYPMGRFEHFCTVCGAWGSFGYGASGKEPGRWYCFAHRPDSEP
jgi:hypothetical protein